MDQSTRSPLLRSRGGDRCQHGFNGYIVFGYADLGLFVLESLEHGNATYVFGQDWEQLSALTKKEILHGGLQEERIIHRGFGTSGP
jgi:hypothetical protein